ncbi:hypothetical protein BKI51_00950 [Alphaproteobacteria bacterium AO1-B]|nr:hypothetical protein BKI51_00950 [Alphaproteobacteria bacterium AO1-B]
MLSMGLKCQFGAPQFGWLPIQIAFDDFQLQTHISCIPENSIDVLILAMMGAMDGGKAEVQLNTEPSLYYVRFAPHENAKYLLRIEYSESGSSSTLERELLLETTGDESEIILPFWRACRQFESMTYKDAHWPRCSSNMLTALSKRIKSKS